MKMHSVPLSRTIVESRVQATARNPRNGGEKQETSRSRRVPPFIRYKERCKEYAALETASVQYEKENVRVDLVGAVHIAEAEYYREMNHRLAEYDLVLYELVKRGSDNETDSIDYDIDNTAAAPRSSHPVTLIQTSLSKLMGFSFQLDSIDHNQENWINADIDFDTFQRLQAERGESIFGFSLKLGWLVVKKTLTDAVRLDKFKQNSTITARDVQSKVAELFGLLPVPIVAMLASEGLYWASRGQAKPWFENLATSPEMKAILQLDISACTKAMLARQLSFSTMFTSPGALKALSASVIVGERNKIAMDCLDREILRYQRADNGARRFRRIELDSLLFEKLVQTDDAGKPVRVAMVYGAAHLPDLEQRLYERSFVRKETSWHSAWTIKSSSDKKATLSIEIPEFDKLPSIRGDTRVIRIPDRNILKGCVALAGLSLVLGTDLALWESFYEYLLHLPSKLFHIY